MKLLRVPLPIEALAKASVQQHDVTSNAYHAVHCISQLALRSLSLLQWQVACMHTVHAYSQCVWPHAYSHLSWCKALSADIHQAHRVQHVARSCARHASGTTQDLSGSCSGNLVAVFTSSSESLIMRSAGTEDVLPFAWRVITWAGQLLDYLHCNTCHY